MKKLIFTPVLTLLFLSASVTMAQQSSQEYLGLPGDNLNLFAVMNLFQDSETLEQFERELNDPENMINNLDLNNDNYVDYIMVKDYVYENIHNIVLRVALNETEFQDVAVFVVEIFDDGNARIQLIGDEALYGPDFIVEPIYAQRPNPGYRGNVNRPQQVTVVRTTYRDVAAWPVIVYMSRPVYRPWRSAWTWSYHPAWWSPWTPHYWHFYHGYHFHWRHHYMTHFRPWGYPRCGRFHTVYVTQVRHYSPTVVVNINQGRFRHTYSQPQLVQQGQQHFAQRHPGRYDANVAGTMRSSIGRQGVGSASGNKSSSAVVNSRSERRPDSNNQRISSSATRESPAAVNRQRNRVESDRSQLQESRGARQSNVTRPSSRQQTRATHVSPQRVNRSEQRPPSTVRSTPPSRPSSTVKSTPSSRPTSTVRSTPSSRPSNNRQSTQVRRSEQRNSRPAVNRSQNNAANEQNYNSRSEENNSSRNPRRR